MHARRGQNSVPSVQPLFFNLRRLAEFCQAAVVVVHHTNRLGDFRGSSSIAAAVDLMLSINSQPEDTLIQLNAVKARHQAPAPFCARAHFDTDPASGDPLFHLTATDEAPTLSTLSTRSGVLSDILKYLQENGRATTPELMSWFSDNSPGTVRNAVHHLMTTRQIKRVNGSTKGKTALFEPAAPDLEQ